MAIVIIVLIIIFHNSVGIFVRNTDDGQISTVLSVAEVENVTNIVILNSPNLKKLPTLIFRPFRRLHRLVISANGLETLPPALLSACDELESVELRGNRLRELPWQAFAGVGRAYRLTADEAGLECACSNRWLLERDLHVESVRFTIDAWDFLAADAVVAGLPETILTPSLFRGFCRASELGLRCPLPKLRAEVLESSESAFRATCHLPPGQNSHIKFRLGHTVNSAACWAKVSTVMLNRTLSIHIAKPDYECLGPASCFLSDTSYPVMTFMPITLPLAPRVIRSGHSDTQDSFGPKFIVVGFPLSQLRVKVSLNGITIVSNCGLTKCIIAANSSAPMTRMIRIMRTAIQEVIIHIVHYKRINMAGQIFEIDVCNAVGCGHGNYTMPESNQASIDIRPKITPASRSARIIQLIVIFSLLALLFLFGCGFLLLFLRVRRLKRASDQIHLEESVPLRENEAYSSILCDSELRHIPKTDLVICREIGEGAFGTVFLAKYMQGPEFTNVAVKTVKHMSDVQVRQFQAEARLMATLKHQNILTFLGIAVDERDLLIVFEYMDVGDLKSYLRERGPEAHIFCKQPPQNGAITLQELCHIGIQAARGLGYLGSNNVVHRDIAARNCLLSSVQRPALVKLSDFGMSRSLYATEYYRLHDHRAALPVRWMPPEALATGTYTTQSDLWSFGVLLWELVSYGKLPYPHLSNSEVVDAATRGDIRLTMPARVTPQLRDLITGCCEMNPVERLPMADVERRLQKLLKAKCLHFDQVRTAAAEPRASLDLTKKRSGVVVTTDNSESYLAPTKDSLETKKSNSTA